MKKLTVFFDPEDSWGRATRGFLARSRSRIELEVFPIDGNSVRMCFPELDSAPAGASLVTLSDTGMLEHGEAAVRTILWALEGGERWSRYQKGEDSVRFAHVFAGLIDGRWSLAEDPDSLPSEPVPVSESSVGPRGRSHSTAPRTYSTA